MNYEQEIIDMENFYSTATIEEAMEFFKLQSANVFSVIKNACRKAMAKCNRILKVVFGLSRFYQNKPSTALRLRRDLDRIKILSNSFKPEVRVAVMVVNPRGELEILIKK